ncbi:hypothetical protein CROQUDRAFT_356913 [Cronartium quercuum f. sp. fusiforme G11]|uniref:Retrotransposon gag domain-containing protein n=1 Tax=Cronartium quercuum f. sp. fusiforme G11 TaxID=708437 RepID=A0A9P6T654_9BASI|nr:hypothetical protein CROQUDRAFT_356913 [Cronartium quercuum f. sp. fusiforme G11]
MGNSESDKPHVRNDSSRSPLASVQPQVQLRKMRSAPFKPIHPNLSGSTNQQSFMNTEVPYAPRAGSHPYRFRVGDPFLMRNFAAVKSEWEHIEILPFDGLGNMAPLDFLERLKFALGEQRAHASIHHYVAISFLAGDVKDEFLAVLGTRAQPQTWTELIKFLEIQFPSNPTKRYKSRQTDHALRKLQQYPGESIASFGNRFKSWKVRAGQHYRLCKDVPLFCNRLQPVHQTSLERYLLEARKDEGALRGVDEVIKTVMEVETGQAAELGQW